MSDQSVDDVDIVADLLRIPFGRRESEEKLVIINRGRSKPELPELTQMKKDFTRHFNVSNYDRIDWLTGSIEKNKLFCWNCLLFGNERNTSWTNSGYSHLSNLSKAVTVHESSLSHIRASIALSTFVNSRIETRLCEQKRKDILLHNEKVKKNRDILKRLINAACFLAKQELSFQGNEETKESSNRGNYLELLAYTAEYDPLLANHLETSTVFKEVSNRIQNDLVDSIAHAVVQHIISEMKQSKFVAVMADETSDISNKAQFSLVYRYVIDGRVVERFLGFHGITSVKSEYGIGEMIVAHSKTVGCEVEKMIAQTYDGAAVISSSLNSVQAKVKEYFPNAVFIHCYAHDLNLVLSQSASSIPECHIFFCTLNGLAAYFSKSPQRTRFLDEFLQRHLPNVCPTTWNYSSRLVSTVYDKKEILREVFNVMLDNCTEVQKDVLQLVEGHLRNLENFQFCFLLAIFNRIFSQTDRLLSYLQSKQFDIVCCMWTITETLNAIEALRDCFDEIFEETIADVGPPRKRSRNQHPSQDPKINYRRLFYEVMDNIEQHMKSRFQDNHRLKFLHLVDRRKYSEYRRIFPKEAFKNLMETYGQYFDEVRLKNELIVTYSSKELNQKSPHELLLLLSSSSIGKAMPQLLTLVLLVMTIPVSTESVELSFSSMKRIKSYSRNRREQSQLSNLALISIESQLLSEMKEKNAFFDAVIEHFATSERHMEFTFK